jgi:CMP-N-acetylneuraminic acid synthetase
MATGVIGYIPAKGRSRGISSKNMVLLGGRPLVEYSIRLAVQSGLFDAVFVSTDSSSIRALARAAGAETIDRPTQLAGDATRVAEVLAHDIPVMAQRCGSFALIACLLPTSPLRRLHDLQTAISLAQKLPEAPTIVSLGELPCGIEQVVTLDESTRHIMAAFGIDNLTNRSQRQSHRKVYYPNGSIVIVRNELFLRDPRFYVENATVGFPIDAIGGIDIDSAEDLEIAELILRGMGNAS